MEENNPTALALLDKYGKSDTFKVVEKIPFSSRKKYSGIVLEDKTLYNPYMQDYTGFLVGTNLT